jgi:phosphocarrier protein
MLSQKIVLNNKSGLHARPASVFTRTANNYISEVSIQKDGIPINGKSILALLSLGVSKGTEIILTVNGEDEELAFKSLVGLIESGFGEE